VFFLVAWNRWQHALIRVFVTGFHARSVAEGRSVRPGQAGSDGSHLSPWERRNGPSHWRFCRGQGDC
jgi:hypothetical protein